MFFQKFKEGGKWDKNNAEGGHLPRMPLPPSCVPEDDQNISLELSELIERKPRAVQGDQFTWLCFLPFK